MDSGTDKSVSDRLPSLLQYFKGALSLLLTNISILVYVGFVFVCAVLACVVSVHNSHAKGKDATEDNFIIYAPRISLLAMIFIVFISGSSASLALFIIPRVPDTFLLLLMVFSFAAAAFAVYCIYGIVYYMSFKTVVNGDELRHKEIFYPEFTFTVTDIKSAEFGKRVGNVMLILSTNTEVILEAEDHFVGYNLLIDYIERKSSVRILNQW